jgi:hypothetical protein
MPEQERKLIDLRAIFDDISKESAKDIITALSEMDVHLWMSLAEDFIHPPSALVNLVKKAGAKFSEGTAVPTEEEKILFLTGAQAPSKRLVEVALFIANNPEELEKFEQMAQPITADREKRAVDSIAIGFGARIVGIQTAQTKKILS